MPAPNIPNEPVQLPDGRISPAWRNYFNEINRLIAQLLGE